MDSFYKLSALKPNQLPRETLPEIGLLGRSNCGKSTFINTLLNKKNLAKTSKFAGRTQTINFFDVDNKFYLVDIPGFGFSRSDTSVSKYWPDLVDSYLKRSCIKYLFFLQDIRRSFNEEDIWVLKNTKNSDKLFIVLTKSDKLSKSNIIKTIDECTQVLNQNQIDYHKMIYFSSLKRTNLDLIRKIILDEFGIRY